MSEATIRQIKQEIGGPVEDFNLTAITGQKIGLPRILWGKKGAVIVFWSGICSHCARYDGYLNRFEKQHPELGIAAVASRDGETLEQLRATARERDLTFPILHDPGGQVANQWSARQTPRVFLIDADRLLLYRGAIDNYKYPGDPEYAAYLDPAIVEFLAGKPISRTESASFGCAVQSIYYNLPKAL
jgi:peroxiredoxin